MKIYIVVCGEYSDYSICGVYLSEEKAKMACAINNENHWDDYRIEEYETRDDVISGSVNNMGWVFSMGDIRSIIKRPNDYYNRYAGYLTRASSKWAKQIREEDTDYDPKWWNPGNEIFVQEPDRDKAISKAIKIYRDRVAKEKAKEADIL